MLQVEAMKDGNEATPSRTTRRSKAAGDYLYVLLLLQVGAMEDVDKVTAIRESGRCTIASGH